MGLKKTTLVALALLLLGLAGVLAACSSDSTTTTSTSTQTTTVDSESTTTSIASTTTTTIPRGASVVTLKIGDIGDVEQGELSVDRFTVTDDLASDVANELLLTGEEGEKKNVSTKPAEGNEFLLVTFKYKKAVYYDMRGGLYSDDIILKDSEGTEYLPVETEGHGGIFDSNAGKVKAEVEAFTTAVFEVPKGQTGLYVVYHPNAEDGFTCQIR